MAEEKAEIKDIPEKIIGRVKEQELLRDLIGSKKSEFIAVYGRCTATNFLNTNLH